jgi:hypothetical protein
MTTVRRWTGAETKALRQAMRLSIRDFAAHIDVGVRTVARWESRGAGITLTPDSHGLLDTAFARVSEEVKQRFAAALVADERTECSEIPPAPTSTEPGSALQLPMVVDGRAILVRLDAAELAARGLGGFLSNATGMRSAQSSIVDAESDAMSPLDRRAFLKAGVGAPIWSALDPDEQAHVVAALAEPRPNLDGSVVDYFSRQLSAFMADDGTQGPAKTLPSALGLVVSIEQSARDVQPDVRRQLLSVGARVAEFVAWLYRDARDPLRAGFWRDRATEWAQEAVEPAMQGYVLLKKAQAAYDDRDALRMLTLSEAVRTGPWQLPAKVRADAAQQEARGHAMLGHDQALVERNLDEAQQLLASAQDTEDEPSRLGTHYNATLLRMQTAICYTEAGQPRRAAELYRQWLQDEQFSPRDYGYFSSLMASALALAGEPDEAARVCLTAWPRAVETDSGRTKAELKKVLVTLQPWQSRSSVRALREAMRV